MTIVSLYSEVLIVSAFLFSCLLIAAVCLHRRRRETRALLAEKKLLYSSPASIPSNRFVIPPSIRRETPSLELFRLQLIYRLNYSFVSGELLFEVVRLTPIQSVIEECFSSFVCQVRLFTNAEHEQHPSEDPLGECFRFRLDPSRLLTSYLKLRVFARDRNARRVELGQTVFVVNQDEDREESPALTRFIQIYQNTIELITRYQTNHPNVPRALVCLIYESDRCLLHFSLIKILGLSREKDQIQLKVCTSKAGEILHKQQSKWMSARESLAPFNTSFHLDSLTLSEVNIRLTLFHRRGFLPSPGKAVSVVEIGNSHWAETLNRPNRPHVYWYLLEQLQSGVF